MIERSGAHQQTVCTNLVGYLCREVTDGYGVLESARSGLTEVVRQSAVGVGQFEKHDARRESERLLNDEHQRIGQQHEHTVHAEMVVHVAIHHREVGVLHHLHGEIYGGTADGYEQCGLEHLRAVEQFAQRVDGDDARHYLYDDELILIFHRRGADENHRHVCDEGCT